MAPAPRTPFFALAFAAVATLYGIVFLGAESERAVGSLLALAVLAVVVGARLGWPPPSGSTRSISSS